jgi:hypothetical protein
MRIGKRSRRPLRHGIASALFAAMLGVGGSAAARAVGTFTLAGSAQLATAGPVDNECVVTSSSLKSPFKYSSIVHTPSAPLAFRDLTELSADCSMQTGCFGGGTSRFSVTIDVDNGEVLSAGDKNVFVYWVSLPNYVDCPTGWNSTGNLIAAESNPDGVSRDRGVGAVGDDRTSFDLDEQKGGPWTALGAMAV